MFHGKLRIHTCRVILLTSLVWFLVDVAILSFYSDCLGSSCKKPGETDVIVAEPLKADWDPFNNEIQQHDSKQESSRLVIPFLNRRRDLTSFFRSQKGVHGTYKPSVLRRWRPAPTVQPVHALPGEMGKAVRIPSDKEAEMKEKFKLNQFNLMASDMISLNRSLVDVRLEG